MRCIKCNEELEADDNFCPNCGELTPHGYLSLKDNKIRYKENNIGPLFTLTTIIIVSFILMTLISGKDMFRPYIEIKKEIYSLRYGYKISLLDSDTRYSNIAINTPEEARNMIKNDAIKQYWKCKKNANIAVIEKEISEKYNIPNVTLCDINEKTAYKIQETIDKVYTMFPNIQGYLTDITITNANNKDDYIAYFEPTYTFINYNKDITDYNKVNKTRILLNSYYFLNESILNNGVKEAWYPEGASYESLLAHELGHYITFVTLLREKNISDVTLITKENNATYQELINILNNGTYSEELVIKALENYNRKYHNSITIESFSNTISNYASQMVNDKLNYDEVIAEAIHDYYLHRDSSSASSLEIINIIKERLQ